MKLVLAILSNDDSGAASNALTKHGFQVTRLSTTGGFLRAGNTTLICGCQDEEVEKVVDIIGDFSKKRNEYVPSAVSYDVGRYSSFPVEVQVGGATIFVLPVDQFIKL
ncbi:MAG: cyclic-di-AMP receptor [Firmicutes bacterium]|nr:cyclic-di-AMP receptor [Bacillota bacterium]